MTEFVKVDFKNPDSRLVLGTRLLCKRYPAKDTTDGGIVLPDAAAAKERPEEAWIIQTGDGLVDTMKGEALAPELVARFKDIFRPGRTVLYPAYSPAKVPQLDVDKKHPDHFIIDAKDVLIISTGA